MKQMVDRFEPYLESPVFMSSKAKKISKPMLALYNSIKQSLERAYGYADIESIFSVVELLSTDSQYNDLGHASTYLFRKLGVDVRQRISDENQKVLARLLSKTLREFVRYTCQLGESTEIERIDKLYSELFDVLSKKFNLPKINLHGHSYSYPNCPIYTTNYDLVMEKYWEVLADINDLWKEERNIKVLDVEKREGEIVEFIKLHGSLNWFQLENEDIVNLESLRARYGRNRVAGELMLYPIEQKDMYLYPWFNLFHRFKNDLTHTTNWIVIGYGFNDEFIRNTFCEVLDEGNHRLIIVSPRANEIGDKFFSDYEGIIRKVVGKFGEPNLVEKIISDLSSFFGAPSSPDG
jgi:hypothetical protein